MTQVKLDDARWADLWARVRKQVKAHQPGGHDQRKHAGAGANAADIDTHYADWASGLSEMETQLLRYYAADLYIEMNNDLRANDQQTTDHLFHEGNIQTLDDIIERSPGLPADATVFRLGVPPIAIGDPKGRAVFDRGYLSTSLNEEFPRAWVEHSVDAFVPGRPAPLALYSIKLPAGTKGAWMPAIGNGSRYDQESEFLLARNFSGWAAPLPDVEVRVNDRVYVLPHYEVTPR